jgi:hypothetical protein
MTAAAIMFNEGMRGYSHYLFKGIPSYGFNYTRDLAATPLDNKEKESGN